MALFKSTKDFKNHAPEIHRNYDWNTLSKKVDQVTKLRIISFVSQAEYDALETVYLTGSPIPDQQGLIDLLQPAIAYFTYLHLLSTQRVQLSTMGVQESHSEDGTSSPAGYHAIADVKEEIADMAYSFMDQALEYMEGKKSVFALWAASESYTEIKACFVWNTKVFNRYVNAGMSRHTFVSVRSQLMGVQEDEVRSELGDTLYDDLLAKLKANTLGSPEEEKAVQRIQAWQSVSAMLRAIPLHRAKMVNGSIFIRSQLDGPVRKTDPSLDAIKELKALLQRQAAAYRTRLLNYLDENSDSFPDYTPSEYLAGDGKVSRKFPNNAYKKSFRF